MNWIYIPYPYSILIIFKLVLGGFKIFVTHLIKFTKWYIFFLKIVSYYYNIFITNFCYNSTFFLLHNQSRVMLHYCFRLSPYLYFVYPVIKTLSKSECSNLIKDSPPSPIMQCVKLHQVPHATTSKLIIYKLFTLEWHLNNLAFIDIMVPCVIHFLKSIDNPIFSMYCFIISFVIYNGGRLYAQTQTSTLINLSNLKKNNRFPLFPLGFNKSVIILMRICIECSLSVQSTNKKKLNFLMLFSYIYRSMFTIKASRPVKLVMLIVPF